jgi:hypothetical protein
MRTDSGVDWCESGGEHGKVGRLGSAALQQGRGKAMAQRRRCSGLGYWATDLRHPGQLDLHSRGVQKEQREQRLPVRGHRHRAVTAQCVRNALTSSCCAGWRAA